MTVLDEKLVWQKFDEEANLQKQLVAAFEGYEFSLEIREFASTLSFLKREIEEQKNVEIQHGDVKALISLNTRITVLYFALFSTQLSLEEYFYKRSALLREGSVTKDPEGKKKYSHPKLHPIVDEWKRSDAVKIVKAIRNRFQHGALLKGKLTYSFRTTFHPEGEGSDVSVKDDSLWEALSETDQQVMNLISPSGEDKLLDLAAAYVSQTTKTIKKLCESFETIYQAEFDQRVQTVNELKALSTWFEQNGLWSPWPTLPLETDLDFLS